MTQMSSSAGPPSRTQGLLGSCKGQECEKSHAGLLCFHTLARTGHKAPHSCKRDSGKCDLLFASGKCLLCIQDREKGPDLCGHK